MDYTKEEIAYVNFCIEKLPDCQVGKKRCPVYESCNQDEECLQLCNRIINNMNNGEILSEDDYKIICFFSTKGFWKPESDDCYLKDGTPCHNLEICNERNEGHEVCTQLMERLDLNAQKIAEKEIQRLIIKNFPADWKMGEKLALVGWEKEIQEINGRIDILLKGKDTALLYVVELKLRATRESVGQLASYVGWCLKHPLAEQTNGVKGILLADTFDKGALSALDVCHDLIVPKIWDIGIKDIQRT